MESTASGSGTPFLDDTQLVSLQSLADEATSASRKPSIDPPTLLALIQEIRLSRHAFVQLRDLAADMEIENYRELKDDHDVSFAEGASSQSIRDGERLVALLDQSITDRQRLAQLWKGRTMKASTVADALGTLGYTLEHRDHPHDVRRWPGGEAAAYRDNGGFQKGRQAVLALRVQKLAAALDEPTGQDLETSLDLLHKQVQSALMRPPIAAQNSDRLPQCQGETSPAITTEADVPAWPNESVIRINGEHGAVQRGGNPA